jgi:hypothetical protein
LSGARGGRKRRRRPGQHHGDRGRLAMPGKVILMSFRVPLKGKKQTSRSTRTMIPLEGRMSARRGAALHIFLELARTPTQASPRGDLVFQGRIVKVFRRALIKPDADVSFRSRKGCVPRHRLKVKQLEAQIRRSGPLLERRRRLGGVLVSSAGRPNEPVVER